MLRHLVVLALSLCACPSSRDGGAGGAPRGSAPSALSAPAPPPLGVSAGPLASAAPPPELDKVVPLLSAEALPPETPIEGELFGVELLFELRQLRPPGIPVHLGAPMPAVLAAQTANAGVLRVALGGARARVRFGAHAFAMDEGYELRADRGRGGAILVHSSGAGLAYRVIPSGALRTLLGERRVDVMPLGLSATSPLSGTTHLGRATTRARVTTAWGTLDLDQISAPSPGKSGAPKSDARSDAGEPGDAVGGGEALCRALLELVAADRALGGPPCASAMIPVRAEIAYAGGGGMIIEATSLREGALPRSELAFPPSGARHSLAPLPDAKPSFAGADTLLSLRAKGEPGALELSNRSPAPRLVLVDGVTVGVLAATSDHTLSLRTGRYVLEWRTPLGEVVERPSEVDVPGKVGLAQWLPAPLSSASPIASARNGP